MGGMRIGHRVGLSALALAVLAAVAAPGASGQDVGAPTIGTRTAAPMEEHLSVALALSGPSNRAAGPTEVALVKADVAAGAAPRARGGQPSSQQLLVIGTDARGTERWRAFVPDPRLRRLETADEAGRLFGRTVLRSDARLEVAAPAGLGIERLTVLETAPTGELVELGAVALPAAVVSSDDAPVTTAAIGDNRIDIAVLGDGYTAGQQAAFAADVDAVMAGFFAEDPYAEYESYFRVNQVPVVSNQSGADHLERTPPTFRDTALGAEYGCFSIARLLCVDEAKVAAKVQAALPAAKRDIVLVLVNDTTYGGSGGQFAVASLHPDAVELALHEIGHSFGALADEYSGNVDDPSCQLPAFGVNVTSETNRTKVPWKHWIAAGTPVPTGGSAASVPGAYEGAAYCDTGAYRPTYDSKMRNLGSPWDQINTEQLIKQMYTYVGPIVSASPAGSVLARQASGTFTLSVTPMQPATHALSVRWTIDGAPADTTPTFTDSWAFYGSGKHEVTVRVADQTTAVRSDPFGLLDETRTWRIPDRLGPFGSWSSLVDQTYRDLLGRAPTTSERTTWTTALSGATSDRGDLVDALRRSTDGTGTVDPTVRLYRAFLQRTPDAGGLRFWVGRKRSGAWTLNRIADHFSSSSEFLRKYGTLTNRQFVTRIYTDVLGRTADAGGVDYWTRQLDLRRKTRGQVMVGFSESSEYKRKQAETTDVAVASIFLLGRSPSGTEVTDWVARQQAGTLHRTLVLELLDSPAYATRIGNL